MKVELDATVGTPISIDVRIKKTAPGAHGRIEHTTSGYIAAGPLTQIDARLGVSAYYVESNWYTGELEDGYLSIFTSPYIEM